MRVLCISGKAQNGKDTSAGFFKTALEEQGKSVLIVHYADLLKFMCQKYFGWDGKKDEQGRHILQYIGTDVVRAQKPDFWVAFVAEFLQMFENDWDYVIIPDTRYPNEIDYLVNNGFDVRHIRVVRSDASFVSPLTEEQQKHISETALDSDVPDIYIANDSTIYELERFIRVLVKAQVV